jgi:DNA-binding NtrC family response regulator
MPALRDRGEDIPRLAVHFLAEAMRRSGRVGITLGRQAMAELCAYDWPGNVSELKRVLDDTVLRAGDQSEIGPGTMLSGGQSFIVEQVVGDIIGGCRGLDAAMAELEAAVIREALQQQRGNRSAAARQLKLPRQTLQDRMKKHGLWS